ncbi:hypothetical protein [Flavobacterium sp. FlaQc-47]|uniref:hypothetical protein n=1 Tax=Flavobacterium sp. FlaQc-47 TaxID=3374180 RepID=UPI003756796D
MAHGLFFVEDRRCGNFVVHGTRIQRFELVFTVFLFFVEDKRCGNFVVNSTRMQRFELVFTGFLFFIEDKRCVTLWFMAHGFNGLNWFSLVFTGFLFFVEDKLCGNFVVNGTRILRIELVFTGFLFFVEEKRYGNFVVNGTRIQRIKLVFTGFLFFVALLVCPSTSLRRTDCCIELFNANLKHQTSFNFITLLNFYHCTSVPLQLCNFVPLCLNTFKKT